MENKNLIVRKASAGSGKTYSLAQHYLKIVLTSTENKAFSKIMAMTFTNKATLEMKERVIHDLVSLAYPISGDNKEVFFGRVNCLASLNSVTLDLDEMKIENTNFNVAYLNENEIGILFDKSVNSNGSSISVYDMTGKLISTSEIKPNTNNYILNITFLSKGIYILNISDKKGAFNQSVKISK